MILQHSHVLSHKHELISKSNRMCSVNEVKPLNDQNLRGCMLDHRVFQSPVQQITLILYIATAGQVCVATPVQLLQLPFKQLWI